MNTQCKKIQTVISKKCGGEKALYVFKVIKIDGYKYVLCKPHGNHKAKAYIDK